MDESTFQKIREGFTIAIEKGEREARAAGLFELAVAGQDAVRRLRDPTCTYWYYKSRLAPKGAYPQIKAELERALGK